MLKVQAHPSASCRSSSLASTSSSRAGALLLPVLLHRGHQAGASASGRCLLPSPQLARAPGAPGRRDVSAALFPFDQAWAPNINASSVAPQLFAFSLFPYLAFLFFLTKSGKTPKLTLIGFYFLLAFVGATIPAGIYAKANYGTALANVDWLHGGAESLLTITNLFIVLGLRQGIREAEAANKSKAEQEAQQSQQPPK